MTAPSNLLSTLAATEFINHQHPAVMAFALANATGETAREKAVSLYYAVRDGFRYDPYRLDLTPTGMTASAVLANGHGWCVSKAILLAAAARAIGIPARLGFADVRNHLTSERLRQAMQTDVFYWHGYTLLDLNGKWVKATPAFNLELCEKARIKPLEFDGVTDSIYHPYDLAGRQHMEYLHDHGAFDDLPLSSMLATYAAKYSEAVRAAWGNGNRTTVSPNADFTEDVGRERT